MPKSFAVLFPGQGSQQVGMLSQFGQYQSIVLSTFEEASLVLGYDLWSLSQNGPESKLNQTAFTQPLLLTAGVAVWRILKTVLPDAPNYLAGHSLGEYTALVAAGSIHFSDAVQLVELRGQLMQQAVPEGSGAMAAVLGLTEAQLTSVCADASAQGVVEMANFNSPGQIVISGEREAVNQATTLAKEAGAKRAVVLPVSVPSHSSLMKPAADEFAKSLMAVEFNAPLIPTYSNVTFDVHTTPDKIRKLLIEQLYRPVCWQQTIAKMAQQGVALMLEAGPGKVLTSLNKRIDKTLSSVSVNQETAIEEVKSYVTA